MKTAVRVNASLRWMLITDGGIKTLILVVMLPLAEDRSRIMFEIRYFFDLSRSSIVDWRKVKAA